MSALALPVRQRTPAWLEERRRHIGSSDAPVLAGERGSVMQLWAEKVGLIEPTFDDETEDLMEIGALLEPALRSLYVARTGRTIRQRHVLLASREWPVAAASLDAESGRRIVELKWSHSAEWFQAVLDGSPDPVPGRVMAQVQWQMYVAGRDVVDVGVLLGRDFKIVEVGRSDRMIDDLLYMARWFWPFVESGERPPADGSEDTRRTLQRLHPRDNGGWMPADTELVDLVVQLHEAKAAARVAADAEATIANAIRAVLGDWSGITGLVSWKKNADSQSVDWKAVAAAYRAAIDRELDLVDHGDMSETALPDREELDAIRSLHTTTKEGPRVLRLLAGGKA